MGREKTEIGDQMSGIMKTIVIDPGHGGKDNGASWGYVDEDDINLSISFLLRYELEKAGHEILMTREKDEQLALGTRVAFANTAGADLFLSIHCDAFHHETVSGMSVHIRPDHSDEIYSFAHSIQHSMAKTFPDHKNRGIKYSNFYVLKYVWIPAVLVECEFLSNPETRRFLKEPENQLVMARSIARGVLATKGGTLWNLC